MYVTFQSLHALSLHLGYFLWTYCLGEAGGKTSVPLLRPSCRFDVIGTAGKSITVL